MTTVSMNRRQFLQTTATASAALFIGMTHSGTLAVATQDSLELNAFVRISNDGTVSVMIKHFEMGQGTTTGLATLVAEELDADWETLSADLAHGDSKKYANLFYGAQGTGGSTAIANSFMQYRKAGAAARDLLVRAAAAEWQVPVGDISVEKGILSAGNRQAHFGQFIARAATLTPTAEPRLKSPSEFKLIGNSQLKRKDSSAKTDGSAVFAMDVQLPGMLYAVILRAPRFGATLTSFNADKAQSMPGFVDAKALPTKAGIAVFAKSTWAALRARDTIDVQWDNSQAENRGTDALIDYHLGLLDNPQHQAVEGANTEEVQANLASADKTIEAEFVFPYLAHAPMEPLNCVIEPVSGGGVRFHDGCQFPGLVQPIIAQVLGLAPEKVEVNTVYAGGSFGRRATPKADYQVEAAMAFALTGGKTAVKLVWSREDDIKGGYYRPMAAHRARIGIGKTGEIMGWDHRIAVKSLIKGSSFEAALVKNGIDDTAVEGINDTHYAIPGLSVGLSYAETPMTTLWWRSVGHTHTAYTMEVLMDMLAEQANQDPVDYRLSLLSDQTDKDQQRLAQVLKLAAKQAGWHRKTADGVGRGVALHKSFNTYVAQIIEVSHPNCEAIKIERVVCAVDCGVAVNPDIIRAQMEGGIGYGLGAIMRNQITLTDGVIDQSNFPNYEPIRMRDMPDIEVHIVSSAEIPTGVGEPGVPPVGPALANAIHALTGKRITRLPMAEQGVEFA